MIEAIDNDESLSDFDLGYWLTSTPDSGFNEQFKDFESQRGPTGELRLFVKFAGTVSPTKKLGYGHLGVYSNQIAVSEVLEMQPWIESQCEGTP